MRSGEELACKESARHGPRKGEEEPGERGYPCCVDARTGSVAPRHREANKECAGQSDAQERYDAMRKAWGTAQHECDGRERERDEADAACFVFPYDDGVGELRRDREYSRCERDEGAEGACERECDYRKREAAHAAIPT